MEPGISPGDIPPFHKLNEYTFESLCRDLLDAEESVETCDEYGTRGQTQHGVDLLAYRADECGIELGQCKRYASCTSRKIVEVREKFFKHYGDDKRWQPGTVKRFILFITCDLSSTDLQDTISDEREKFKHFGMRYEVWGPAKIRNKLRPHPSIVSTYLDNPEYWVKAICGVTTQPATLSTDLPQAQVASVVDSALRESSTAEQRNLLPPPPGLMLGRTDEIRKAKRALGVGTLGETPVGDGVAASSRRRTAAVHGWPGVGKSTFVAALCGDGEVRKHFSGGVFFVPVGPSPEVHRLAEEVCAALEVPAPPGATFHALRGRIAEALSRKPTLIVFDDVWEERYIAPLLLTGGASATLVATRRLDVAARLSTEPEGALRLSLLSDDDSLELIRSRAPAVVAENKSACRELAEALDGLPLALRVAADLLRVEAESGFNISDLLVELGEAARVLDEDAPHEAIGAGEDGTQAAATSVSILLQKSIERLDEDLVKRFVRLGVLPPKPLSFEQWAAEDVWRDAPELPDPEDSATHEERVRARKALGELARRGLIESAAPSVNPLAVKPDLHSDKVERFWMHALMSAFALENLEHTEGEGGVREAHQRRLEHYRWVVAAANVATLQGGDGQYFGVLLMTLDLPNIRAAHSWAHAHSPEDRRALEYLSRLPAEGHRMLFERLAPDEFVEWMKLAEGAARKTGDEGAERSHRATIGAALLKMGQLRKAKAYSEGSLEDARHNEDHVGEATALANLASISNAMGQHEAALSLACQAEETAGNVDAPDIEIATGILIATLGQQAKALRGLGRISEAEECHEARRDLAWEQGEHSQYARALMGIAEIKRECPEERDEAREIYAKAAKVFRDLEPARIGHGRRGGRPSQR